jgi:hypothetical protein
LNVNNPKQLSNIGSLEQPYSNKFKVVPSMTSCRVEYIGESDGCLNQFIFNQVVPYNAIFTFKIKIIKTKEKSIMIGVVD